ncbi:hypothetical protein EVAR_837_1 [Eumeta japonica]|uniref:Uncharacterized protein n=1 Tax=Eumeta variegata TaxID=151549 RepID=A0A4C1SGH2_EUMVA|nr:hypothetical protein EVAR_837_1 [Eumeta japonica]
MRDDQNSIPLAAVQTFISLADAQSGECETTLKKNFGSPMDLKGRELEEGVEIWPFLGRKGGRDVDRKFNLTTAPSLGTRRERSGPATAGNACELIQTVHSM